MAYNRIKEGWSDNQTWHHLKKIFGVNCWLASSAAREARGIFNLNKNKTIIFGGPNTPDMVAASIEIARRAYKKFEKGWSYPKFNVERLDERWKQTLAGVKTWKELAQKIKESGLKYRFLLADCIRNAVFRTSHKKGRWKILYFS